jgi:ABC-type transport system involved in cytochrome bd biosynthesis fused ATPase/permease subunit
MAGDIHDDSLSDTDADSAPPERRAIPLHRAVAVITAGTIAVRQTRAGLVGPLIELVLTIVAVWAIMLFINSWPLGVLFVLALVVTVLAPLALIGFVNNIAGSSFLMERAKESARWQQGLLGLGIGTFELVPFGRVQRFEVTSDYDDELASGMDQDVVDWQVMLIKDNDKELTVGRVVAARFLAREAGERANALAAALGEMSGAAVELAMLPPVDDAEDQIGSEGVGYDAPDERRHYRRID